MDTLILADGVCYGQAMSNREVQQQNTARVQIGGAVPHNHAPPGLTVNAHMSFLSPPGGEGYLREERFPATPPETPKRVGTLSCHLVRKHKQQ